MSESGSRRKKHPSLTTSVSQSENLTGSTLSLATSTSSDTLSLPWIRVNEPGLERDPSTTSTILLDTNVKPGQYVLQSLFAEFTIQAERKIEKIMSEPLDSPLAKFLQRGEDPQFDQLLSSLSAVSEHCLPSLLKTLFDWYDLQNEDEGARRQKGASGKSKGEKDYVSERRDLAVDFLYCLVLIEVLKQLPLHPVPEKQLNHIETLAFKHFKHRDSLQSGPNTENFHIIADLYAEVLGVLAQTRFMSVRKRFLIELKELRSEPQNVQTAQGIISLIMGMKFYRVKMFPVEDFEASFQLLHECANYYLEVKDKDIKHALAGLLVEILVPVASCVMNEVNIPVLKNFVDKLYQTTLDQCSKKKHALAAFPLLTCLLCVSQKQFFLSNWCNLLNLCLSPLNKHRDPKMSRVALESLYRLLWVYVIRIKCESNMNTQIRLQSIVNCLFPKGSRNVVPRDTPLNIFVKILQFIAQEKLEFAMRDVIFDLLGVNSKQRVLCPERMNIGLRAFLVIADDLQQKDGVPPMPTTTRIMPSGNTLRVRKTFLNKQLTEDAAKSIGVLPYYPSVRKAVDAIIRTLDAAVGRALLMTNAQCLNKELDDLMTSERRPKIELFRTCIAAIPRIIPDGMSRKDLLELLTRLTVHRDDELRGLAFTSLQNMVLDLPEWRDELLNCFINFILRDVADTFPLILESALKMLLQLLSQWRTAVQSKEEKVQVKPYERNPHASILNTAEGFALVFLCSCRPLVRRLSYFLLKEVRALFGTLGYSRIDDDAVIDVVDRACPSVVEGFLNQLPPAEKATITAMSSIDLHWVVERSINQWSGSTYESAPSDSLGKSLASRGMGGFNPWITCLARFFDSSCLPHFCPAAVSQAWPVVHTRLTQLYAQIDPNAPSEGRTSIRSKKTLNPMDENISLWRNYLVFACSCAPPGAGYQTPRRCISPDPTSGASSEMSHMDKSEVKGYIPSAGVSAGTLFKMLVPLIKCDNTDTREAVVNGLGWTSPSALRDLLDELQPFFKDAVERKQENMRRKRRRDFLRVHLIRVFELLAEHGAFKESFSGSLNKDGQAMHNASVLAEYIEGMRLVLESEGDKDSPTLHEIRLHYSGLVARLIKSIPAENRFNVLPRDVRYSVFFLCGSLCRKLGVTYGAVDRTPTYKDEPITDLEMEALQAMCGLLVCGEVFDSNALSQEGYLYTWLDNLLNCSDERVVQLGKETVLLLLQNNPQQPMVLRWAIYRCYTGPAQVANGYFQAMASVFNSNREGNSNHSDYPCEVIPTLCVVLFKTADPYSAVRATALQLLQVLYKRFFGSGAVKSQLQPTYGKSHKMLSHDLARLHPELTLAVFSEITERFESAHLSHRKIMLEILLPWLYNVELVSSSEANRDGTTTGKQERDTDPEDQDHGSPFKTCGWGSKQASDIVLNNLFFITSEYGDDHSQDLEQLWAALCTCWSGNLKHILTYLMTLAGIMTNPDLLPYVKQVMIFIAQAKPQKLMDELMKEMFSIELVNSSVERIEEAPYFQLFNQNKFAATSPDMGSVSSLPDKVQKVEAGRTTSDKGAAAHRRCSSGGALEKTSTPQSGKSLVSQTSSQDIWKERDKSESSMHHSNSSLATLTSTSTHSSDQSTAGMVDKARLSPAIKEEEEEGEDASVSKPCESLQDQFATWRKQFLSLGTVIPLPVPEEVYCAPLSDFIDDIEAPPSGSLFRCNLATVLMTDLVSEKLDIDWSVHLPQILHVLFLGLDHSWPTVHEHCKRLLLKLLIALSPHNDYVYVAQMLLSHQVISDLHALTEARIPLKEYNFIGGIVSNTSTHPADNIPSDLQELMIGLGSTTTISAGSTISVSSAGSAATVIPCGINGAVQINVDHLRGDDETSKALMEFLVTRKCRPLWSCEEITPKVFSIKSAEQIETFLRHVVRVFQGSVRGAHLEQRWAQLALSMALSCPSRHYAGRSFQIFRALNIPLSSRMLSEILSRLVETVAEQGEETQGYVTEILLTLEASIDVLASELVFSDHRERCKTGSGRKSDFRKSTSNLYNIPAGACGFDNVKRHSISSAKMMENASGAPNNGSSAEMRPYSEHRSRSNTASEIDKPRFHRSRSTQSLKMGESSMEDRLNLMTQLFWIFVSLLESDYEYEFLMALRSLDKLMKHLPLDRGEIKNKLEHVLSQLQWEGFPGLQALLLKGFTSIVTSDLTLLLVSRLTGYTHLRFIDPTQAGGFPMNIVAVLPYLIQHFDRPDTMANEIALNIGKVCQERYTRMAPLSTVLTMYRDRTYNRDSKAWTSVVCRYIHNAYSQFSIAMMTFLIEVLEKGPMSNQAPVLQIVYNLIHNIDLMAAPMQQVNDNLLRVIAKYVQGPHWQESLNILKVAVSKSSSLVKPPSIPEEGMGKRSSSLDLDGRKELPGRTMEFTFDLSKVVDPDVSNTPVIRRKFPSMLTITTSFSDESATSTQSSDDSSMSTEPTEVTQLTGGASNGGTASANQSVVPSAWRKPQLSMRRTRERLVNVLNGLGQKVGLPRSPSVIFSSTSDITQERQNSLCSSSESTSLVDAMNPDGKQEEGGDIPLLKVFDFLEGEEGEQGDEKGFKFNWYHSRMSLEEMDAATNPNPDSEDIKDESSDDETSDLPGAEDNSASLDAASNMRNLYSGEVGPALDPLDNRSSPTPSNASSISDLESISTSPVAITTTHSSSFLYIPVDEVEEAWRAHVDNVMRDLSGRCAVNTFHVFTQLYKVMQQRFCNLTREACNYLGDKLRDIALQFLSTLDLLTTHADCPYVYIDTETLIVCRLLERHKYCVIELHEHYDTYISKRDLTVECLDSIKASLKMQSLGAQQDMNGPTGDEQQIELCRRLYRLYFQLRMLFDSYCKLILSLNTARQALQVTDYSQDVSAAKDELIQASEELESGQASLSPEVDTTRMTPESALRTLAEHLGNRQLRLALRLLHVYRSMWSGDLFGSSEEDDLDVLLALFCKHLSEGKTGVLVVTRSGTALEEASQRLMDTNMQLMASLRKAEAMETKEVVTSPIFEIKKVVIAEVPDPKAAQEEEKGSNETPEIKKDDTDEEHVQSEVVAAAAAVAAAAVAAAAPGADAAVAAAVAAGTDTAVVAAGAVVEISQESPATEVLKDPPPKEGPGGDSGDASKPDRHKELLQVVEMPSLASDDEFTARDHLQLGRKASAGNLRTTSADDPLVLDNIRALTRSHSAENISTPSLRYSLDKPENCQDSTSQESPEPPVLGETEIDVPEESAAEEEAPSEDSAETGQKSRPLSQASQDSISTDL